MSMVTVLSSAFSTSGFHYKFSQCSFLPFLRKCIFTKEYCYFLRHNHVRKHAQFTVCIIYKDIFHITPPLTHTMQRPQHPPIKTCSRVYAHRLIYLTFNTTTENAILFYERKTALHTFYKHTVHISVL